MNKRKKKGFTIVELVIVIAVIAILASVLIPTFSNIIKKAHRSADTQLVRNLNTAVAIDLSEKGLAKHSTMYDAVQACAEAGYLPDVIVAKSDFNIAWEQSSGHFVLLDMVEGTVVFPTDQYNVEKYGVSEHDNNAWGYFAVTKSKYYDSSANVFKDEYKNYSVYAYNDGGWPKEVTVTKGFDAGSVTTFTKITYANSVNAQDVVIRTNTFGTKLVIDGKSGADGDNVSHYGYAAIVNVLNVANASYDECGVVGRLKITNGHIEVMKGAEVFCLMEVGGSSTVATTVNEGGIVHENQENKNVANDEIEKGDNGVANGLIDDCGPGKHTFSEFVDDDNNTYDVCTCCGYCLVHVKDASGNEIKQSLNQLVPANDGTDRYIVKEISSGVPDDQITPVLNFLTSATIDKDNLPKENVETTTHLHDYKYTSNGDGTHNGNCNCGEDAITKEACDTFNVDGSCSKCGYKKPNAVHEHNYQYTYNGNKTHKKYCSCGEGTIDSEACDSKGDSGVCSKCGNITKFEVTLNKQGGEGGSGSVYAEKGESMPSITLPTKPGYTFDGYYSAVNGGGTKYYNPDGTSAQSYDLTGSITLYAKWTVKTYNITYYDMGGKEFSGEYEKCTPNPASYTYNEETTLSNPVSIHYIAYDTMIQDPSSRAMVPVRCDRSARSFYDFAGWYTDSACTEANKVTSLAANAYTADIKLYAKWTPKTYTIIYHDEEQQNQHVNNSLSVALTGLPTTHTYGTTTTLPNPVEREGWVFLGWYTDLNATYNKITSLDVATNNYIDYVEDTYKGTRIHLYAKWAYLHKITLKNDDTTMGIVYQPEDEPMVKLTSAQIPTSTKTGYAFDGYYYTATGGGTKYYNSDGTSANDFLYYSHAPGQNTEHTLYARWKPIEYTITYNLNGGSHGANYPTTHTYNTATPLVSPTKDGYTFKGWYTKSDFSGTALTSLSATGYTKNITLYAKWEEESSDWTALYYGGNYYPVFDSTHNISSSVVFGYTNNTVTTVTPITKPAGGYTMQYLSTYYSNGGTLYYQGGSVTAVKFVNGLSSYEAALNAKDADDIIHYDPKDIGEDQAYDVREYGYDWSNITINGIKLSTINNAYSSITDDMIYNSVFCRAYVDFCNFDMSDIDGDYGWLYVNASGYCSRSSSSYYYIVYREFK